MSEYRVDRFKAALREAKALLAGSVYGANNECQSPEASERKRGDYYQRRDELVKQIEELEKL